MQIAASDSRCRQRRAFWRERPSVRSDLRILYVLRNRFGTLGSNSSFMVPTVAHRDFHVKIVDFESIEVERGLVVYENAEIDCASYPHLPTMLRLPVVRDEIERFNPDIVHHFYHNCSIAFPFFLRSCLANPPKYLVDIRSPPVNQTDELRRRDLARNALTSRYCDIIATHCHDSIAKLVPDAQCEVLYAPPGVDVGSFKSSGELHGRPLHRFVYAGSLAEARKLDAMIEGFSALAKTSAAPVTLDIFGDGPARDALEAVAKSCGTENIITFRGKVAHSALAEKLSTFDAGIAYIPHEWFGEAPALKFLEYAASGLAVFASATPGLLKQTQEGIRAELFSNTAEDFCSTVLPWTDKTYPADVLAQNRLYAESQDWEVLVKRDYYPVYHRLADARAGSSHGG
jgi:glycosyltransferase involved in cell wall biosynthesis